MKDKSVKVSEATYKRIIRIADGRSIKATIEIAIDYMEGLRRRIDDNRK